MVLNFMANALRQPLVDPLKALQFCSNVRFRCRQISAWRHSGKPFSTWADGAEGGRTQGQGGIDDRGGQEVKEKETKDKRRQGVRKKNRYKWRERGGRKQKRRRGGKEERQDKESG